MLITIIRSLFFCNNHVSFSIKNVPCGTSTVTCSKASTISIGAGETREQVQLLKGEDIRQYNNLKRIKVGDQAVGQVVQQPQEDQGRS